MESRQERPLPFAITAADKTMVRQYTLLGWIMIMSREVRFLPDAGQPFEQPGRPKRVWNTRPSASVCILLVLRDIGSLHSPQISATAMTLR
jgi:hypothetical protein